MINKSWSISNTILIFFLPTLVCFQSGNCMPGTQWAEETRSLFIKALNKENLTEKLEVNDSIRLRLTDFLKTFRSGADFDSVKYVKALTSPDNKVMIITWNIPAENGYNEYFGFIQVRNPQDSAISVFELKNRPGSYTDLFTETGSPDKWFGALYYEIVEKTYFNTTYYTLLGFDYNDGLTNRKVIEVLKIIDNKPIFGASIFKRGKNIAGRLVFEYSEQATMLLRYDPASGVIVYDHLSPFQPNMVNNPQFYGPDFSFDALEFVNGYWIYKNDVDLRNPKEEIKRSKPRDGLEPLR